MYISRLLFSRVTATTEIYTLSLHDALPIWRDGITGTIAETGADPEMGRKLKAATLEAGFDEEQIRVEASCWSFADREDRKSTRLNSSHTVISYAVFCLKKKKEQRMVRQADR